MARYLGVDRVWLANDLAYDRYRNPLPAWFARLLGSAADLVGPRSYGDPVVNVPTVPMVDEHDLTFTADRSLPPVQLFDVSEPVPIVRTSVTVSAKITGTNSATNIYNAFIATDPTLLGAFNDVPTALALIGNSDIETLQALQIGRAHV